MNAVEIGKRIKTRRCEIDMTQEELAKDLGFNKSTIQRYETGQVKNIKIPVLHLMARTLKINPDWLACKTDIKSKAVVTDNDPTIETYKKLNPLGKQKASDYIQDLSEQPKYIEPVSSEETEMQLVADVKKSVPAIEEDETTIL